MMLTIYSTVHFKGYCVITILHWFNVYYTSLIKEQLKHGNTAYHYSE